MGKDYEPTEIYVPSLKLKPISSSKITFKTDMSAYRINDGPWQEFKTCKTNPIILPNDKDANGLDSIIFFS